MPSQRQGFIELEEIINDYLNESEQSNQKYFKLWHIAYRGYVELGSDFFWQNKSVKLPINENLTVNLPNDFMSYSKVGVLNDRGEIIPLYYNTNLTTFSDLQPQRIAQTQDPALVSLYESNTPIWYNYWNGTQYSNLYGLPSGSPFVGSFKIDAPNGVILLSENFGYPYLMLEYVATPNPETEIFVPLLFKEAMIAYLRWKDVISIAAKNHVLNSNIAMRRTDYYNERRLAIARYKPVYLQEVYQTNLQNTRLTAKA